jgi:hypothetical protein
LLLPLARCKLQLCTCNSACCPLHMQHICYACVITYVISSVAAGLL